MNIIEKSIRIALEAHKGQLDRAGKPYILHPLRLMNKLEDEIEMISAVLHDVVEDSDLSFEDLKREGIPDQAVEIIQCLTKIKNELYEDYIKRVSLNKKAINVKIKDLEDNMNIARLDSINQKDLERLAKYLKALTFLKKCQQS
jgi:guanosine-3',5'-bis(diphosphate) 3'-pyrophosphohydrolase